MQGDGRRGEYCEKGSCIEASVQTLIKGGTTDPVQRGGESTNMRGDGATWGESKNAEEAAGKRGNTHVEFINSRGKGKRRWERNSGEGARTAEFATLGNQERPPKRNSCQRKRKKRQKGYSSPSRKEVGGFWGDA